MSRKIRIYKILPEADGIKNWGALHRELLAPLASPDVEITQVDLPHAPITTISSAYDTELVAALQTAEALKGQQAGYDAVVMGCLHEPGVPAAKEALDIPVVGEAEAAMHYASLVGRRFSFVGGSPDGGGVTEDLVRKYGFWPKLASIRKIRAGPLDFATSKEGLREAILTEARRAVEEDGADAIIGYGGIDFIGYLQEQLDVPVISPIQASVLMAESLVRLNVTHSKRAFPTPGRLRNSASAHPDHAGSA